MSEATMAKKARAKKAAGKQLNLKDQYLLHRWTNGVKASINLTAKDAGLTFEETAKRLGWFDQELIDRWKQEVN